MPEPTAHSGRDGLGDLIGLEYLDTSPDEVRARIAVTDEVRQPAGLVHGGVYAAMAESICSAATWLAVHEDGMAAMGQSNDATLPPADNRGPRQRRRPAPPPGPHDLGVGRRDHGRRGRIAALIRMTVAVRPVQ